MTKVPKGPKGEKRPADVIGNAVKVMRIAVGEELEEVGKFSKRGSAGGLARAQKMTPETRSRTAKNAATSRWAKKVEREKIEH
jgi:hypothetical protein